MTKAKAARPGAGSRPLEGRVAVVAGATRGAGRGIARAVGEAGAVVYCTGRSMRGSPSPYNRPETVEETVEMVNAAGGRGIAVRVAAERLAQAVAAMEKLRIDLLRLRAGNITVTGVTENLGEARELSAQVRRLLVGLEEGQRTLARA